VSPNKLHHLFLPEWKDRWPHARLYAAPGLGRKKKRLHFDAELGDEPESLWMTDIDQVVFRGSFAMEEVVFFHRASRTAIKQQGRCEPPVSCAMQWSTSACEK
jgi:hypothetical protein